MIVTRVVRFDGRTEVGRRLLKASAATRPPQGCSRRCTATSPLRPHASTRRSRRRRGRNRSRTPRYSRRTAREGWRHVPSQRSTSARRRWPMAHRARASKSMAIVLCRLLASRARSESFFGVGLLQERQARTVQAVPIVRSTDPVQRSRNSRSSAPWRSPSSKKASCPWGRSISTCRDGHPASRARASSRTL